MPASPSAPPRPAWPWLRRAVTRRVLRAYSRASLTPDSPVAYARYVAWLLVATLVGATECWEDDTD